MTTEIPVNKPEKRKTLDDNARKFLVEAIDTDFLSENGASSFSLTVDWLEATEDNEKKVAYKQFNTGDVQILLITKVTQGSNRTSEKEKINEVQYRKLVTSSILHLKKKRYEFTYTQNGIPFSIKYDEIADGRLHMLEVDALSLSEEERDAFAPSEFPLDLKEVTGDMRYYGYRVAQKINFSDQAIQ